MQRKPTIVLALCTFGLLLSSWASAYSERPKLWAALSVSRPLFHSGSTKDLFVHFTIVNDGDQTIDPKIDSSKIIINGAELEDSGFILGNGPRDARWKALPSGDTLEFSYALESHFKEPGIYRVSWKGDSFETPTIVFRVVP